MSNLHERATRVVAIALVPAFVALGVVAWQIHLPAVTALPAEVTPRAMEEPIVVPPPSQPIPLVAAEPTIPPPVVSPKPRNEEAAQPVEPPKERHCDEIALYGSGTETVRICEWN